MADHHWVHDHIASYLAGGLDAAERADLEAHLAGCADCTRAVQEVRQLDQQLAALFTGVRPTPDLEDRAIRRLRLQGATRSSPLRSKTMRFLLAAAAMLLLGLLGAGMSLVAEQGGMLFASSGNKDRLRQERAARAGVTLSILETDGAVLSGTRMLDGFTDISGVPSVRTDKDTGITPAWALAEESRRRHLLLLSNGRELNLTNDEVGRDADLPTNYNVDRIEDATVSGKMRGGLPGGAGGQGWSGAGGATPDDKPSSGSNAGPGNVDGSKAKEGDRGRYGLSLYRREGGDKDNLVRSEAYFSYVDQGKKSEGDKRNDAGYYPARALAVQPAAKTPPVIGTAGEGGGGASGQSAPKAKEPSTDRPPAEARDGEKEEGNQEKADPAKPEQPPAAEAAERKIIRTGELEFEVDDFDVAVERIEKIVAEEKGVIATKNSDKLPNGKMKGSVVLRVPPRGLDDLIKKLRLLGELKRQRLGSADVTKLYYDIDSRLKAARVMEKRLLEIIAKGGGMVKDLIEAEKELGSWRTRIEEFEGEVRYYNNLVGLATLTIILVEKDIRTAYAVVENRKVDLGIQVEDVEAGQRKVQELVLQAKGRVTSSNLRKGDDGSLQAILHFEASPDAAGPLLDGLKQLGSVVRQDVDQSQQTEGGVKRPLDAKVTRADVQFQLSLYNLATVQAEQGVVVKLACVDVADAYKKVLERVEKSAVRVLANNLEQALADQTAATLIFEVKTPEADAILALIKQQGEVMRLQEVETKDSQPVTKTKRGFRVEFVSLASVEPREVVGMTLVATDVPKSYQLLQEAVAAVKGRTQDARLDEKDRKNVEALLNFQVRRADESAIIAALARAGAVFTRAVARNNAEHTLDSRVGYRVLLRSQSSIPARETMVLGIEVPEVEKLVSHLGALADQAKGRTVSSDVSRSRSGEVTARVIFQVPLSALHRLTEEFKREGHVSYQNASRNSEVPENELAIGQLDVTLSSRPILRADEGFAAAFRAGLEWSGRILFACLIFVLAGLVVTSPFWLAFLVWYVLRSIRARKEPKPAV